MLALTYPPLAALHALEGRPRLRALLCHDIPPERVADFRNLLEWLARRWVFVSPEEFETLVDGTSRLECDSLLLTFDDGFASNRVVAEAVLRPLGIKALFFIVGSFVTLSRRADQIEFISNNLGLTGFGEVPAHMRNMSFADIQELLADGHSIGAHTQTHLRLSSSKDHARLADEIAGAADRLEHQLGGRIQHFAFPFGNLASFSPEALSVARRRFRFVHTGMRGNNSGGVPTWAIRRDAINPDNSRLLAGAFLEGAADRMYAGDIATYESWGQ
jgi:peptidoglycan/xylan/chitin deacetylase (PgdA/CDA1 family)